MTRALRELVVLNRRLTAEEQFRGATRRNEYTSDGPSGVGMRGHPYRPLAVGGRPAALAGRSAELRDVRPALLPEAEVLGLEQRVGVAPA